MSTPEHIPAHLAKALAAEGQVVHRAFTVDRASVDQPARTVQLAFASETPYERYWGIEILDCTAAAIRGGRLNSGANLLIEHCPDDVVGVVESVTVGTDRVARAIVRFGKSADAEEIFQDVIDGIRRNVSVGYMIHKAVLVEEVDGVATYRITDWEPFEISLVAIPADATVGVGRNHQPATPAAPALAMQPNLPLQEKSMSTATLEAPAAAPAAPAAAPVVQTVATRNHSLEITNIACATTGVGIGELALKSIQAGHTVEQFQQELIRHIANNPLPTADVGLTKKEAQHYSVLRAVRSLVDRDFQGAGFEREVSKAILKRQGLAEAPNNGIMIPYEVQKRDLTAGSPSGGGYTVATDNLASSFIDLLRNRTVLGQLGITMLSGLQGNVTIPKQTAAGTAYWLSTEATQITESQLTFGQLALSPKNIGVYTEISRQLMMQSSPSADALVLNDLARDMAIGIDLAGLWGTGASGQPTGVCNTAGIGGVTGTSIDYAKVLEFQTDVAGSNALTGKCAYVTTPSVAALLLQRQRFTSTDTPLWAGNVLDGTVSGFPAKSTLQMTAASMMFGDWSQVVMADWGSLELALNPYANFQAAITGIRAIQSVDIGVRIAAAFSLATSIT